MRCAPNVDVLEAQGNGDQSLLGCKVLPLTVTILSYISRVTRPVIKSAAHHTKLRLNHVLRRTARPSLL
jgi:hypothetical protein